MKSLSTLIFSGLSLLLQSQPDQVYSVEVHLNSYFNGELIERTIPTHTFIFDDQGQLLSIENHLESLVLPDRDIGKNYKHTSYQYKAGKLWKERTQFIAVSGEHFPQSTRTFIYKDGQLTEIREEVNPDSVLSYHFIKYDDEGRRKQVDWLSVVYDAQRQSTDFTHYDTLTYSFQWDRLDRCQVLSAQSTFEFSQSAEVMTLRSFQDGHLDQDFRLISDDEGRLGRFSFEAQSTLENEEKTFHYSDSEGLLHRVNCRTELFTGGYSAKLQNITRSSYELSYSQNFKDISTKYLGKINKCLWEAFIPNKKEWEIYGL